MLITQHFLCQGKNKLKIINQMISFLQLLLPTDFKNLYLWSLNFASSLFEKVSQAFFARLKNSKLNSRYCGSLALQKLDLVENFAVTNFSTKSVDHCISIYFKPSKKQTFLSITEWNLLYFPFSREQSTKISFYSLVVQC